LGFNKILSTPMTRKSWPLLDDFINQMIRLTYQHLMHHGKRVGRSNAMIFSHFHEGPGMESLGIKKSTIHVKKQAANPRKSLSESGKGGNNRKRNWVRLAH